MPTNEGHWGRFRRGCAVLLAGTLICSNFGMNFYSTAAKAESQESVVAEETSSAGKEMLKKEVISETEQTEQEFVKTAEETELQQETAEARQTEAEAADLFQEKTAEEITMPSTESSAEAISESTEAIEETLKELSVTTQDDAFESSKTETTVQKTEEQTQPVKETETINQTEPVKETETINQTESVKETETINQTEPVKETETIKQTQPEKETETVKETEAEEPTTQELISSTVRIPQKPAVEKIEEEQKVTPSNRRSVRTVIANKLGFTVQNQIADIEDCQIVKKDEKNLINITGTLTKPVPGNRVFLMELGAYEYSIQGKTPIASAAVSEDTVEFQTELGDITEQSSKLYSKFVLAYQQDGNYVSMSQPHYITNPEAVSKYQYDFPVASSKKGLQGSADMVSDSIDLGVPNIAVNLRLDDFVSQKGGTPYVYKGKTYYFNESRVNAYDHLLKEYYDGNMVVSMIILLGNGENTKGLMYDSAADTAGYSPNLYAIDTSNKEDAEWVEAIMSFLGERYTREDGKYGQVVNWIMGNEINSPRYYNWMGAVPFDSYVSETARTYRIFTTALRSSYSEVRTYFSMDFFWGTIPNNSDPYGNFASRLLLDALDKALEKEGDINWNLAYHAYPSSFDNPAFWEDPINLVNQNYDTRIITMSNINVLNDYVKENYGKDTRIILSEQGFSSTNRKNERLEEKQAAAFAYGYYITEFQDMIDSFIITRHVDNRAETDQGYYFGLWTNEAGANEKADKKKMIWDVFKYIDTPDTLRYTNPLLKYIDGVSSWESDEKRLEDFSLDKFEKMPVKNTRSVYSPGGYQAAEEIDQNEWKQESFDSRNKNLYWGYVKEFDSVADFTEKSVLLTRLNITSPSSGVADVKVRVTAGEDYYEANGTYSVAEINSGKVIGVDLSSWPDRNKVTKIQIWVNIKESVSCSFTVRDCVKDIGNTECVPVTPIVPTEKPEEDPSDGNIDSENPSEDPSDENAGSEGLSIVYQGHVQNIGWMDPVQNIGRIGTVGKSLRMEALKLQLNCEPSKGQIIYGSHVQNVGWMSPVTVGMTSGTVGKSLRMESVWIRLTGEIAQEYDLYYRAHVQNKGWLKWVKNGEYAGTTGKSLRLEALEIQLVKKGDSVQMDSNN